MKPETRLYIGLVMILVMLIKIQIHKLLDKKNGHFEKSASGFRFNFLLLAPYFESIKSEDTKLRIICNILWLVASIIFSTIALTS